MGDEYEIGQFIRLHGRSKLYIDRYYIYDLYRKICTVESDQSYVRFGFLGSEKALQRNCVFMCDKWIIMQLFLLLIYIYTNVTWVCVGV